MSNDRDKDGPVFSAEQARQGEIILRTRAPDHFHRRPSGSRLAGIAGVVDLNS
ncbi:peptide ABC transporter permease [Mesorhizobium sp. M0184]|uniref:peptide ABC transporter permease n=1 Tax=Mesorhizobium sp. M0184 TaxID=2956906 RepID=UPI00333DEEE5